VVSPDEQAALALVRDALVSDCGGSDAVSTARQLLIDLAAGGGALAEGERVPGRAQRPGGQAAPAGVAGGAQRAAGGGTAGPGFSALRDSQDAPRLWRQQLAADHVQVRQREQAEGPRQILGEAAVADLGEAPQPL
jgi:hypothetical protein